MRKFIWPLFVLVLLTTLLSWQYVLNKNESNGLQENIITAGQKGIQDVQATGSFTFEIIPGINNTWGYDILSGKMILIHQPCIPAVPGNDGFKTREAAEKVAKLVIRKLGNGEMPPTISIEEMKKIKAI